MKGLLPQLEISTGISLNMLATLLTVEFGPALTQSKGHHKSKLYALETWEGIPLERPSKALVLHDNTIKNPTRYSRAVELMSAQPR